MLVMALWALLVWSLFGAAITRVAAVALARGDKFGFRAALAHGIRRWPLYFGAPAIPLAGVFVIAIPLLVLGLLMRVDFFVFLGSLIWPLTLLAGFVMALLLIGLAVPMLIYAQDETGAITPEKLGLSFIGLTRMLETSIVDMFVARDGRRMRDAQGMGMPGCFTGTS